MSSVRGRRPTATRSSSPRSSSPPSSRSDTCPPSPRAAASARAPVRELDPGRARAPRRPARWRTAPRRRGCGRRPRPGSTLEPRLLHACAISTPTTPPPRISSRSGTALGRGRLAVGPRARLGEPVDRRHRGGGAGGDDDRAAGADDVGADGERALAVEGRAPADQLDSRVSRATAAGSSRRGRGSPRRGGAARSRGSSSPADHLARARHPLDLGEQLARAQQRLRRHAGVVGALARRPAPARPARPRGRRRPGARRRPRPPARRRSRSRRTPARSSLLHVSLTPQQLPTGGEAGEDEDPRAARGLPRQARSSSARPSRAASARDARPGTAPRFVIQEHHARRLHWDLRLEHDGVLLSWALPRGVPEDPEREPARRPHRGPPDRVPRLPRQIPKGEYGAGDDDDLGRGDLRGREDRGGQGSSSASTASASAGATRCSRPAARTG